MRVVASSSVSALASFRSASLLPATRSPVAFASSSSHRLFHSSGASAAGKDDAASKALEGVQDLLQEVQASTTYAPSPNRMSRPPGRSSFDVSTPGAAKAPQPGTAQKIQYIRRAFAGQHYTPSSLTQQAIVSERRIRARPLLGPSKAEAVKNDEIHRLQLKPSRPSLSDDSYKNPALLSSYVSEMGKILPRSTTGLTWKSQRMVGKAVRRARAMGLMPVLARASS
ncbi:unnamed protein product [Parajaminaea phylloscopi]